MWAEGFLTALQPLNLLYLVAGTAFGMLIGALPGLGPLFGVALMLPLTFGMPAATAIIFLTAVHAATAYGDSFASIMINAPGGVGSVASCWDGHPMAQKGQAGVAMGISTFGSFIGGVAGWISLVALSPLLIWVAVHMGPPEYFMVAVMALSLLALASEGQLLKGLALGGIGLLLSFVGRDPITAESRFTLGWDYLEDGLPLAAVVLGLFALSQAIVLAQQEGSISQLRRTGNVWEGFVKVLALPATIARASAVGIFMGVLPALGLSSANVVAYFVEKRAAKDPENFGRGDPRGLLAPEIAKNACIVGDLIPTFTLGIPGSSVTAIFLAAMIMHGLQPGAEFFSRSGALPYTVFAGILFAQVSFFVMGLLFARQFAKAVLIPNAILVPIIVALSFIASLALRGMLEDVLVTFVFGILGYIMSVYRYPAACLVLGLVLGDLVEANFHRSLLIGRGSYTIFFTRPFSLLLLLLTILMLLWPYRKTLLGRGQSPAGAVP
ncbi:MAG TPA: tripartite tricarboxylate transporter permease [candidate division Zixibacteria bacterium]|nr:tripartite tricarboxylate transporter permease [candidate division Zixibacteria bacterium]